MTISQEQDNKIIYKFVAEDFSDNDPVRLACLNIVHFIARNPANYPQFLTFAILRKAANLSDDQYDVLHKAIGYLTGSRAKALLIRYEYNSDDYEHELTDDEVELFIKNEQFYDPRSGELVERCAEHIYIFFRPNHTVFH